MFNVRKPEQPENAPYPIVVMAFGIVIVFRPEQEENARVPNVVTVLGIVNEVKPVQLENAFSPTVVTEFGKIKLVIWELDFKALAGIAFVGSFP